MADAQDTRHRAKHRKSTCAGCRRRKSKCDGKAPKCTTCIAYKDECVYDKPPSLAYVRSLEDEVQELKNQLKAAKTQAWLNKSSSIEERKLLPATSPPSSETTSATQFSDPRLVDSISNGFIPPRAPPTVKWESAISVDERGAVSFHNPTSAVHEPPTPQQVSALSPLTPFSPPRQDDERVKIDLVSNADKQKQMEDFAVANTAAKVNLPKEISDELLKYHWCWIHPLFVFVYRPAFTRGMTLVNTNQPGAPDPPYFSETLLRVMQAHTARFLNHDVYQQHFNMRFTATQFMQQMTHDARVALAMETLNSSSIPTIQALLQQSAREIVFGRSSQGWLYGGMAFRMAFDMGIHLPSDKLQTFVKSLSPEDIEIRKRLFWSCYTWDKVLSLYLGRMPAFTPVTDDAPLLFLDDFSDNDLWTPYYGETPSPEAANNPPYPPCPGYIVSCFAQLCKLCIIINDLLQSIYSSDAATRRANEEHLPESKITNEEPFLRIARNLQIWWTMFPPHLKIIPEQLPSLSPPIHVMSVNMLYHTTVLLLHRPVVLGTTNSISPGPTRSYITCLASTKAIRDLLVLQAHTYGFRHISYLNAYCAYMAATVAVLHFEREHRPGRDHTSLLHETGLEFLLDVLANSATAMPALERSNAIIRKRMKRIIDRPVQTLTLPFNQIPSQSASYSVSPVSSDAAIAQPSIFQTMSHPGMQPTPFDAHQRQHSTDTTASFVTPQPIAIQWQTNGQPNIQIDPQVAQYIEEFLPAFPGQQFPVGSEHSFSSGEVDSQAKMALLGYNLDPHPRLNPGEIDWSFMDMPMNQPQMPG